MLTWPIDLTCPPEVVAIGKNIHGFLPSEKFLLHDLWSLHLYRYSGELVVEGQTLPIKPGHAAIVPPGVENEYRYQGVSAHLYVHFRIRMQKRPIQVRAMQDLEERFTGIYERLSHVIGKPDAQVEARVWDVLWELTSPPQTPGNLSSMHPSVELVTRLIEERLSRPMNVAQLAREADLTPSYLSHLFRQVHGESVLGYIRGRRLQQAIHLLQNSTSPIKVIAASVGYPDLKHFNKVFRSQFGLSPRAYRSSVLSVR